jgi:hypothetical protein
MSIPAPTPQVLRFFGTSLVFERSPGHSPVALDFSPPASWDPRIGLTRAFAEAMDGPRGTGLAEQSLSERARARGRRTVLVRTVRSRTEDLARVGRTHRPPNRTAWGRTCDRSRLRRPVGNHTRAWHSRPSAVRRVSHLTWCFSSRQVGCELLPYAKTELGASEDGALLFTDR